MSPCPATVPRRKPNGLGAATSGATSFATGRPRFVIRYCVVPSATLSISLRQVFLNTPAATSITSGAPAAPGGVDAASVSFTRFERGTGQLRVGVRGRRDRGGRSAPGSGHGHEFVA